MAGTVAMYALQLASGKPSALVDWNNNYGDDPNKCVLLPLRQLGEGFLPDIEIGTAPILGHDPRRGEHLRRAGRPHAGGSGDLRAHHDRRSRTAGSRAYVGEGRFTDDPLETFGTRAVVEVPELQKLMRYICRQRLRAPRRDERVDARRRCSPRRWRTISAGTSTCTAVAESRCLSPDVAKDWPTCPWPSCLT